MFVHPGHPRSLIPTSYVAPSGDVVVSNALTSSAHHPRIMSRQDDLQTVSSFKASRNTFPASDSDAREPGMPESSLDHRGRKRQLGATSTVTLGHSATTNDLH
ncbi:unnamed protein product, partial [Protopolystoma xenopodis]